MSRKVESTCQGTGKSWTDRMSNVHGENKRNLDEKMEEPEKYGDKIAIAS